MEELIGYAVYSNAADAGYMASESAALNHATSDYWMPFYLGHQIDATTAPASGNNDVNGNYLYGAIDSVEAYCVIQGIEAHLQVNTANASNIYNAIHGSVAETKSAFVQFDLLELLPILDTISNVLFESYRNEFPVLGFGFSQSNDVAGIKNTAPFSNFGEFELLLIFNLNSIFNNGFSDLHGNVSFCSEEPVNLEVDFTGLNLLFPVLYFGATGLNDQVIGQTSLAPDNNFATNSYLLSNSLSTEKDYLFFTSDGIKLNSLVVDYALSSDEISIGAKSIYSELHYSYKYLLGQGRTNLAQNFAQPIFYGDYKKTSDNSQSTVYLLGEQSAHPLMKYGTKSLIYFELSYSDNFNLLTLFFGSANNIPLKIFGKLAFYQGIKNLYPNKDILLRSTLIGLEQQGLIKDATIRPQGQLFPFKRW